MAPRKKVFVVNALRALEQVAPGGNPRQLGFVVVLGGSALDFEIPEMIAEAVATGLVARHALDQAIDVAVGT